MEEISGLGVDISSQTRYWCHICSQVVNPIMEIELKCPSCHTGFIEEMDYIFSSPRRGVSSFNFNPHDRSLSLWAPILLGIMGHHRRRFRPHIMDHDGDDHDNNAHHENMATRTLPLRLQGHESGGTSAESTSELYRELDSIIRRRRRSSATILHLLRGIRAGMAFESDHSDENNRERDHNIIYNNPFNQTIIIQGSSSSYDTNRDHNNNRSLNQLVSLGDYFIGPGLDMLLQHLADNDPNRNGTPPAQKEEIEALPVVKIEENLQCSVCLDEFELGGEAKLMPCKHKFHGECILPWLELHSSCPLCRYQLIPDEPKRHSNPTTSNIDYVGDSNDGTIVGREQSDVDARREGDHGNERRFYLPWPLNTLFSSTSQSQSQSQYIGRNFSVTAQSSDSASSTNENTVASRIEEN